MQKRKRLRAVSQRPLALFAHAHRGLRRWLRLSLFHHPAEIHSQPTWGWVTHNWTREQLASMLNANKRFSHRASSTSMMSRLSPFAQCWSHLRRCLLARAGPSSTLFEHGEPARKFTLRTCRPTRVPRPSQGRWRAHSVSSSVRLFATRAHTSLVNQRQMHSLSLDLWWVHPQPLLRFLRAVLQAGAPSGSVERINSTSKEKHLLAKMKIAHTRTDTQYHLGWTKSFITVYRYTEDKPNSKKKKKGIRIRIRRRRRRERRRRRRERRRRKVLKQSEKKEGNCSSFYFFVVYFKRACWMPIKDSLTEHHQDLWWAGWVPLHSVACFVLCVLQGVFCAIVVDPQSLPAARSTAGRPRQSWRGLDRRPRMQRQERTGHLLGASGGQLWWQDGTQLHRTDVQWTRSLPRG